MSLALYMDVHVPRAITCSLTAAGVNVVTAQEDGCARMPDPELLDRASSIGRILFTRDDDLLVEAVANATRFNSLRRCDLCSPNAGEYWPMHSRSSFARRMP